MKTKKESIKRKIVALIVASSMFIMVCGTIEMQNTLAADALSNLVQNFVAGTLQISAPGTVGFSDINVGVATNSTVNLNGVGIRDYRGSGAGWSVAASMNNMYTSASAPRNFILNGNIAWDPSVSTLTGLEGASTTGIAKGSAGFFDSARTLINASANNGMGNFILNGTQLNIVYFGWGNQTTGTYQNTLTLTIS